MKSSVSFRGIGLHTGRTVRLTVHPASAEYGIWFQRTDVGAKDGLVPARWDVVAPSRLCTRIENADGVSVSTIEHLMAALSGCGIHNALIEMDGPEVPIMDGSAAPFVDGLLSRGARNLKAPVRAVRIMRSVEVTDGPSMVRFDPSDRPEIDFEIAFSDPAIGQQRLALDLSGNAMIRHLSDSRTFCRSTDVQAMQSQGLALGGSLRNALVVDGHAVLSPGGLRHKDEPVRHKILDALGDLMLATGPILGRFTGRRSGHALTNQLMRKLFADPGAFRVILCDEATAPWLPGAGVALTDLASRRRAA